MNPFEEASEQIRPNLIGGEGVEENSGDVVF